MNRVHVFVRCYVNHQMAPARAALVVSCAAPRIFPVRGSPHHSRHNVNDLQPRDYSVDAAVAVPGNR
jgi:hypothetical protein